MAAGAAGKNNNKHYYLLHWLFAFCGSAANKENSSQTEEAVEEEDEENLKKKEEKSEVKTETLLSKQYILRSKLTMCAEKSKRGGAHPTQTSCLKEGGGGVGNSNKPNKRTATIESNRIALNRYFSPFSPFLPLSFLPRSPLHFALPATFAAKLLPATPQARLRLAAARQAR